jgi:hypothetical protein
LSEFVSDVPNLGTITFLMIGIGALVAAWAGRDYFGTMLRSSKPASRPAQTGGGSLRD